MKKISVTGLCLAVSLFVCNYSIAAGQGADAQMGVSQQELTRERLEHGPVTHRLMLMTNIMSQAMGKISLVLQENQVDGMKRVSGLMREASEQAREMSRVMEAGSATQEEMMQLQNRAMRMQQKMTELESAR